MILDENTDSPFLNPICRLGVLTHTLESITHKLLSLYNYTKQINVLTVQGIIGIIYFFMASCVKETCVSATKLFFCNQIRYLLARNAENGKQLFCQVTLYLWLLAFFMASEFMFFRTADFYSCIIAEPDHRTMDQKKL